jgi:hypothetical protein
MWWSIEGERGSLVSGVGEGLNAAGRAISRAGREKWGNGEMVGREKRERWDRE